MYATITIQTYNRADTLAITLENLRSLYCPENIDYEILVVNNNSNDHTVDIIDKYREQELPLGDYTKESDIVHMVLYLCSNASNNITGQIIEIDGGVGVNNSFLLSYLKFLDNNNG